MSSSSGTNVMGDGYVPKRRSSAPEVHGLIYQKTAIVIINTVTV